MENLSLNTWRNIVRLLAYKIPCYRVQASKLMFLEWKVASEEGKETTSGQLSSTILDTIKLLIFGLSVKISFKWYFYITRKFKRMKRHPNRA